jgi:hypothetical protein
MSNPTSNFGWQMPTATDLVTDLPADFEVFGQAVDTALMDLKGGTTNQVLAKNSDTDMDFKWVADAAGMTNPMTTTGDTIYSSSGSTPARLGIGTAGQFLKVNSGATAPEWATLAPAGASFTELAATATTSGSTVTISGLSGYNTLWITWEAVGTTSTAQPLITVRFNADTGSNYSLSGFTLTNLSASTTLMSASNASGSTSLTIGNQGASAGNNFSGGLIMQGANTAAVKVGQLICGSGGTDATGRSGNFRYTGTSVIDSVSIITAAGTFDEGTLRVLGSVN